MVLWYGISILDHCASLITNLGSDEYISESVWIHETAKMQISQFLNVLIRYLDSVMFCNI